MPPKPAGKAKPGGGAGHDGGGQDDEMGDNFDANVPVVLHVEPKDQVKGLNKEDLEKELNRVLYPQNPQAPQNFTEFSYKERGYKKDDQVEQTVFHLSLEGGVLLEGSDEANEQEEMKKRKEEEMKKKEEAEAVDVEIDEDPDSKDNTKRLLRSQFRFSDRASQTFNPTLKSRGIMTEPPPTSRFTSTVTQWAIFDRYMEDILEAQQRESNESKAKRKEGEEEKEKGDKKETKKKQDPLYSGEMRHALKIMERLVNQNAENEIYMDFKYFEDLSDEFREGDGTLLPLWRFASEKTKRKQVTAIAWSPKYPDLFAVGLGSYDFLKQGGGVVCCYTLKNTTHPEYLFNVEAGVCSLDWHPAYAQLLCVGLYDGTVLVFDVQSGSKRPLYASSVKSKKHTDPVWEVRWNNDETSANLNFYSVSSDGRVSSWSLMKKALEPDEVMELKLAPSPSAPAEEEEISLSGLAGGTCLDFSPFHDHLFVVGTEEGRIHKCSKAYSGQYLETYDGHSMGVYTVRWNPFHEKIFISASADWTVKLWDHTQRAPVMAFDLGQAVGDCAWAPYSSTVFAAISADGVVKVYDLHENRHEHICDQKVVKKAKLTHVVFSPTYPILLVGDDRAGVNCLKLSPNLRKKAKPFKEGHDDSTPDSELQIAKMDHLIEMVSETVKLDDE